MSFYTRAAQQWISVRDIDLRRAQERIAQQDAILVELNQELSDASEPDNADAIRADLAKWTASRDAQQTKVNEREAEIARLTAEIPSDADIAQAQGERDALRTPYLELYDRYRIARGWIPPPEGQTRPELTEQQLQDLQDQMDAQRPALDAKQAALDTLMNTKNRNTGMLPGQRRYLSAEQGVLDAYNRTVNKLTTRLAQPSERKPGIEAQITAVNERKSELASEVAEIREKYGKYAAKIAVGGLYYANGRRPASDVVNASIFADAKRGGATFDQMDDAFMDSEDLIDEPIMEFSMNGWPQAQRAFNERRATRQARRLVRQLGAMLAGVPHWTLVDTQNYLNQGGYFAQDIARGAVTEAIMRAEAQTIKDRVETLIENARDAAESAEGE